MYKDDRNTQMLIVHFVEADAKLRAELVRAGTMIGYHCELYSDYSELAAYPPRAGIIIVRDQLDGPGIGFALDRMFKLGISLPVVAMDYDPTPGRVVQAVKDGALDYLVLPLKPERLEACLARVGGEAARYTENRERAVVAQRRLSALSNREAEVLEALAVGGSNKEIARQLQISPRTVEIHRANMMAKLGARHAAEAIRMRLEATLIHVPEFT